MKFYSVLVLFVLLSSVHTKKSPSLPNFHDSSLQKAFVAIAKFLAQQNHLVTIIVEGKPSDRMDLASFASTAGIPHVIRRLEDGKNFTLNSSAIVSLESGESLNDFNDHAILSPTFSTKQQLFIHCRVGVCHNLRWNRFHQPIIQYEYFVAEEKESIHVITLL